MKNKGCGERRGRGDITQKTYDGELGRLVLVLHAGTRVRRGLDAAS